MARHSHTAPEVETPAVTPVELSFPKFGGITVDANTLPAQSIHFLLSYGFKQLLSDSMAGKAKEPVAAEAVVRARLAQIIDGSVGVRVKAERSAKVKTLEQFIQEVAKEKLSAFAKAKGMELPKGDKLKPLLEKIIATDSTITRVAQERFDLVNASFDSEDLFGMLTEAQAPAEAHVEEVTLAE